MIKMGIRRIKENDGVSDIIGTVLMLVIAVIIFSSLIAYVLSSANPSASPPDVHMVGYMDASHSAVVEHRGGDSIPIDDMKVIIWMGEEESESFEGSALEAIFHDTNNNSRWDIGDYIDIRCITIFGNVTHWQISLAIVDKPSNSIVMSGVLQQGILRTSPPVAMFEYEPINPKVGRGVTFNASESYDPDGGSIDKYEWDFNNDGVNDVIKVSPKNFSHTFSQAGVYNVKLTVTDDEGQTAFTIAGVGTGATIPPANVTLNEKPVAFFTNTSGGNGWMYFDGSQSYDLDGTVTTYKWDFGDGTGLHIFDNPVVYRPYSAGGANYTVTLIVIDNDGALSDTASSVLLYGSQLYVPPIPPIAVIDAPGDISTAQVATFDASSSYDPDNNIPFSYEWDFNNDGNPDATGVSVQHQFMTIGNHTISLKVTDTTGGVGWCNETVYVRGPITGRKFLIVDNTPLHVGSGTIQPYRSTNWEGISNIIDCLNIGDVYDYGKVLDQSTFYAYYNGTWHNNTSGDPNYDPVDINSYIMGNYDIVIWSNGDYPGDGKWWSYGEKPNPPYLPNAWNTPINEGSDDYSNHADKLRNLLDNNGTFLLCGTYAVRDLQDYPGNGASDDEVEFGERLGLEEPDGGIDESLHGGISGYFADDTYNPEISSGGGSFGYGPKSYPGGTFYGVPGTSSGGTEVANLIIEGELPIYSVIRDNALFSYSLNITDIPGGGGEEIIFEDGFEDGNLNGWTIHEEGDGSSWEAYGYWEDYVDSHSGSYAAVCPGADDDWLITPQINVPTDGEFSFWARDYFENQPFEVLLSTTGTDKADFDVTLGSESSTPDSYTFYSYDISAYAGSQVYLCIRCTQTDSSWPNVDDVEVTGTSSGTISGHLAIDAAREGNRSIVLGFDLNNDAINDTSRAQYILNALGWLAEGVGYPTKIYVDNSKEESWYDDTHVDNIQEAIERVMVGGTIYVNGTGTPYNNINMIKSASIMGRNINGYPVIEASGDYAVRTAVDWTYIENITITSSSTLNKGIYLYGSSSTSIINCNISNAQYGIYAHNSNYLAICNNTLSSNTYNIYLERSIESEIEYNEIYSGNYGIYAVNSYKNKIESNEIYDNVLHGIYLSTSNDNDIQNSNKIYRNGYGIFVYASDRIDITLNTINNSTNSGVYFDQSSGSNVISNEISNNTAGMKTEDYCSNIYISENEIYNNVEEGILMTNSNQNTISDNNISDNQEYNIKIYSSNNNLIVSNSIGCSIYGVYIYSSISNEIISNVMWNNTYGLYCDLASETEIISNSLYNSTKAVVLEDSHSSGGNNNISKNEIYNSGYGIEFVASYKNKILNNTIYNTSAFSVIISSLSNNNELKENTISDCLEGIYVQGSTGNNISHNDLYQIGNHGISLNSADDSTLFNNTILNASQGISLSSGCNSNIIRRNVMNNNTGDGISIASSYLTTVSYNEISNNNGDGVYLDSSDTTSIMSNNISVNSNGIHLLLSGGTGNNIMNNTIYGNTNHGVYLENSKTATAGNNEINENRIYGNGGDGIYLLSSKGNSIQDNINISSNTENGIHLHSSNDNVIANNKVSSNTENGIHLHSSNDNSILTNELYSNIENGIYLYSSSRTAIENNSVFFNGNHGIYFQESSEGSSYLITYNQIWNNTFYGVYLNTSDSNHFTKNNIWNNSCGINISHSTGNEIKENNISTNSHGIFIAHSDCTGNTIWWNNLINNHNNASQAYDMGNNSWYVGTAGNYWSDYQIPYPIPPIDAQDKYPLMGVHEWW